MSFLDIIAVILPVFLIIGAGYLFGVFKRISLEPLIEVLLYLTIPALVISSLTTKKIVFADLGVVSLAALTVVLGTGLVSFLFLTSIRKRSLKGFYLPTMFMNSGNIAFPLSLLAFGRDGLALAVIYYVSISILVYTLGIYIVKGKGGWSEMFKLPLLYAAGIGVILNAADLRLPQFIASSIDLLGSATIPLMLVSLGYRLRSTQLTSFWISIGGAIIRIGAGFLIAYAFVTIFGITGLTKQILILSSSMPSAVINFIMSHRYNVDSDIVASIVVLSTIMSIVTIPIILYLVQ